MKRLSVFFLVTLAILVLVGCAKGNHFVNPVAASTDVVTAVTASPPAERVKFEFIGNSVKMSVFVNDSYDDNGNQNKNIVGIEARLLEGDGFVGATASVPADGLVVFTFPNPLTTDGKAVHHFYLDCLIPGYPWLGMPTRQQSRFYGETTDKQPQIWVEFVRLSDGKFAAIYPNDPDQDVPKCHTHECIFGW